jgi:hypothetical protein
MEGPPTETKVRTRADGLDVSDYLAAYAANISQAKPMLQKVNHAQRQLLMKRVSRQVEYEPGDYAYVERIAPSDLQPKWDGPFRVLERVGSSTYRLDVPDQRHPVLNEDRMKPYFDRHSGLTFP